ncbi:MAG: alkylhydroperoxidase [Chlorobi bacterium]|nr:alkylhydroperoxidase [Chlorobiota bacterium]
MPRLPYTRLAPEAYRQLNALSGHLKTTSLGEGLLHLIYLRVSQINGCPYCVDLHWRDADALGEDHRKLNGVVIWRDTPFFSDRERAALAWAETVTVLKDQQVPVEEFEHARLQFSDVELTELTFAIAAINAWNRLAIAFHAVPVAVTAAAGAAA